MEQRPKQSEFDPPRRSPRQVPAKPLTVAVLNQGLPMAYGVVADISKYGICVQSGEFAMKRDVDIVLSFADGKMLKATGRIVWEKPFAREGGQAAYGLEFTELSDTSRASLDIALESPSFTARDS